MVDDMVMRSVYLRPSEDSQLRDLAHKLNVTKSDLIRSAIGLKLVEWLRSNDSEQILRDIEHGRRDQSAVRSGARSRRQTNAQDASQELTSPVAVESSADEIAPTKGENSVSSKSSDYVLA